MNPLDLVSPHVYPLISWTGPEGLVLRCAFNDYSPTQKWPCRSRRPFDLEPIIDFDPYPTRMPDGPAKKPVKRARMPGVNIWLTVSFLSLHNLLHLLFCYVLSIFGWIQLVFMALFWAAAATIKRDSVSLLRFLCLNHVHVFLSFFFNLLLFFFFSVCNEKDQNESLTVGTAAYDFTDAPILKGVMDSN